jgi:hypothetical protein
VFTVYPVPDGQEVEHFHPSDLSGRANGSSGPICRKLLHNFHMIKTSQVWGLLFAPCLFLPAASQRWVVFVDLEMFHPK